MNKPSSAEVIGLGVDWITRTSSTLEASNRLLGLARRLGTRELSSGATEKKWKMMGYQGLSYGAVKWGIRGESDAIIMVSGAQADLYYDELAIEDSKVTRTDVQVTVRLDSPQEETCHNLYRSLMSGNDVANRRASLRYISSLTGDTMYVGKRGRGVMLRFYDKSKDYPGEERGSVWRYEVEYGRTSAPRVDEKIGPRKLWSTSIPGLVLAEFIKRGIVPEFDTDSTITAIEIGRTISSVDSKVRWLQRCVYPVVSQLVSLGYEDEVIGALSLRSIIRGINNESGSEL